MNLEIASPAPAMEQSRIELSLPYRRLILSGLHQPVPSGDENAAGLEARLMTATSNNLQWLKAGGAHGPLFNTTGFDTEGDENSPCTTYTQMPGLQGVTL
eukprot:6959578-Pyramimonas_sp.AAC.1